MATDEKTSYLKKQLASYLMKEHPEASLNKPFRCLNPDHQDSTPSMSFYEKKDIVKCFSCGATYDLFDLIGIDYNLSSFTDRKAKAEAFFPTGYIFKPPERPRHKKQDTNYITEPAGPGEVDHSKLYQEWHKRASHTSYFKSRGLSQTVIDKFNLGYSPTDQSVIIPCTPGYYVKRSTKPGAIKYINIKNSRIQLFNASALEGQEPVFITEGAFDALSIIEAGQQALALNSSTNTNLLINELETRAEKPKLILFLDNDEAGRAATTKLINYFTEQGIDHSSTTAPAPYKDANDFLLADPQGLKQFLIAAINTKEATMKPAQPQPQDGQKQPDLDKTSIIYHLDSFISMNEPTTVIPTGFDDLDSALDGGLHEGLIILGAQSSLGKTTLALQIALQAALTGQEVLFYSLEQSTRELITKLISCQSNELTIGQVRKIMSNKETSEHKIKSLMAAAESLRNAKSLKIIEDKRTAEAIADDLINRAASESKPLVIIDYLQILQPPENKNLTDKQTTDFNVTTLKIISKKHKIPILAISSFNRQNYETDITEAAFKESGAIEYSSDLLLGLQFSALQGVKEKKEGYDHETEKSKEPRRVQIKIIKNRNGISGKRINFNYCAATNCFKEIKKEFQ